MEQTKMSYITCQISEIRYIITHFGLPPLIYAIVAEYHNEQLKLKAIVLWFGSKSL